MNTAHSPLPPDPLLMQDGHILVVEDDADTLDLLRECLAEAGFRVTAVPTIEAALVALVARRFDLVLSDAFRVFGALDRDPWSALTLLRAAAGDTPCVILSANDALSFAGYAGRGFAGLVLKPFDIDGLVAAIRGAIAGLPGHIGVDPVVDDAVNGCTSPAGKGRPGAWECTGPSTRENPGLIRGG
jgi:two-component system, NtrC family, response regulator GlrR